MGDDRPVEEVPDAVSRLTQELADFKTTVMARIGRNPTGDVEPTFRSTAKAETLLCQGQAVSRTTYAVLFQWATDQGLIGPVFGVGDGTTTFVLPDLRGRVLMGAGALGTDTFALGAKGGASTLVLAVNQMPVHTHTTNSSGFTNTVPDHGHGTSGFTNSIGNHGGHFPTGLVEAAPQAGQLGVSPWNSGGSGGGGHNHTVIDPTFGAGGHNHTIDVTVQNAGGSTAVDVKQPYIAVNFLIWI